MYLLFNGLVLDIIGVTVILSLLNKISKPTYIGRHMLHVKIATLLKYVIWKEYFLSN